jgi:hypothetical protein
MQLNVVYNFRPGGFYVIYCFSSEGLVDPGGPLQFQTLEDLKQHALRLAQDHGLEEVRVISAQDFNIGVDGARDLASFRAIFTRFGEALGDGGGRRKKGLFGKLFS